MMPLATEAGFGLARRGLSRVVWLVAPKSKRSASVRWKGIANFVTLGLLHKARELYRHARLDGPICVTQERELQARDPSRSDSLIRAASRSEAGAGRILPAHLDQQLHTPLSTRELQRSRVESCKSRPQFASEWQLALLI